MLSRWWGRCRKNPEGMTTEAQRHRDWKEEELGEELERGDDPVTAAVIGAATEVHKALGPGLLESAYAACLAVELREREIGFEQEVPLPVRFKGHTLEIGYRLDFIVQGQVVVELKAVERIMPVHEAQLLTYLKLSSIRTGLLLNFNAPYMRDGIVRRVL